MSKLNIIIVNWNTGRLLAGCLKSLLALPEEERALITRVAAVDNASTDNSLSLAREAAGDSSLIRFMPLSENVGFARANNLAAAKLGLSHHILLLNPDTEVRPGSIAALLSVLEKDPKIGIVGPKLLNPDGSLQPSVRNFPTWGVLIFFALKLHRIWKQAKLWRQYLRRDFSYETAQAVDQVMGAAFLIRDTVLQEIGLLDEGYWIWFEEVDYCQRVHAKGWKVFYTPEAEIIHAGGASFGQWTGISRYIQFMKSASRYAYTYLM